jgi:hypothetical protein
MRTAWFGAAQRTGIELPAAREPTKANRRLPGVSTRPPGSQRPANAASWEAAAGQLQCP